MAVTEEHPFPQALAGEKKGAFRITSLGSRPHESGEAGGARSHLEHKRAVNWGRSALAYGRTVWRPSPARVHKAARVRFWVHAAEDICAQMDGKPLRLPQV